MVPKSIEGQAKECFSKKRYKSEKFARYIMQKCFEERRVKLRTYVCPICCGWHITHLPEKEIP